MVFPRKMEMVSLFLLLFTACMKYVTSTTSKSCHVMTVNFVSSAMLESIHLLSYLIVIVILQYEWSHPDSIDEETEA